LGKLNYFIPIDDDDLVGAPPWELIAALQTRLSKFVDACKASNFEPHFVVDNGWVTDEARDKWMDRKAKEVTRERRFMPLSADTLLCEMIRALGATLYYAEGRGDGAHPANAAPPAPRMQRRWYTCPRPTGTLTSAFTANPPGPARIDYCRGLRCSPQALML
jgi:hypothetical protein